MEQFTNCMSPLCRDNANLSHYTFLVIVLPKSVSVIIPKAQNAVTTLPSPMIPTTPVITSVISLAKIPALQPTTNTNSVLTGAGPKEVAEIIGNVSFIVCMLPDNPPLTYFILLIV